MLFDLHGNVRTDQGAMRLFRKPDRVKQAGKSYIQAVAKSNPCSFLCRKETTVNRSESTHRCDLCGRDCHSCIGLHSHNRRCSNRADYYLAKELSKRNYSVLHDAIHFLQERQTVFKTRGLGLSLDF